MIFGSAGAGLRFFYCNVGMMQEIALRGNERCVMPGGRKSSFFSQYRFEIQCAGWIWLILTVVFLSYWSSFFVGNHDFRFMRYGVPLDAGLFEGRFTQFVPSWLLTGGHILPVANVLIGFLFFAAAAVILARWFGLNAKYREVLPFALLIVLNPYVLTQLYYVHQILSIFCWHLLGVLGIVWIDRGVYQKDWKKTGAGVLALFFCLGGYAASLELVPVLCAGKFWLDILYGGEKPDRVLKHYFKIGIAVLAAAALFAIMIKVLQMCGKTDVYTYNVRVAAIQDWPGLFLQRWAKPWNVLWSEYPYNPPAAYLLMSGIALTALAVSWRQRKFWYGIFCFAGMVYGAYIVTFFYNLGIF